MKKLSLLFVVCGAGFISAQAQTNIVNRLEHAEPGQGTVRVFQDPRITELLGLEYVPSATGERKTLKSVGYRVQLYAGNNTRQAKNEAHEVSEHVLAIFPELPVYTTFNPPRWLCRVGDFRSIEEADALMRRLRATGEFKEVAIVKDYINIIF